MTAIKNQKVLTTTPIEIRSFWYNDINHPQQQSETLTKMTNIKKTNNYWQLSYIYQEIMTRMDTKQNVSEHSDKFRKFWQQLEETDISDNNSTNSQKFLTTRQQDINPKLSEHYLHNNQANLKTTSKKQTILTIIRKFWQHFTTIRKLWNYQNILTIIRKYNTDTNNYSNKKENLTQLQQ